MLRCLLFLAATAPAADPTRVLPEGQSPEDARLTHLRNLNDKDFVFTPPATREAWAARREAVREQVLVANGLGEVVHGKIERDGYTIEKVSFASTPGHYVCGNLYRPTGKTGKLPGVLVPHGHWANGRFHEASAKDVEDSLAKKGDKTPESA